jgi:hypothetical protein
MRKADGDKYKDLVPYEHNHEERKEENPTIPTIFAR